MSSQIEVLEIFTDLRCLSLVSELDVFWKTRDYEL